jgi:ADP-L-glycero-D-manno-heptose 6-epimerase
MIIVTGGAGFIGSVLARRLNELGHRDLLIVDQGAKGTAREKNIGKIQHRSYCDADSFVKRLEGGVFDGQITAIFHQGACSSTTEMNKDFLRDNNTLYTQRLAEWCVKHGVYFSYASSAATYGAGEHGYSDADDLNKKLKPLNPYGQSKLDFDLWALASGFSQKITGFRYFNVYGPNEYHKEDMRSVVHKGFEQIRAEGGMRLFKSYKPEYPDGGQKRDFIYVKDMVEAVLWFWKNPSHKGIFNLGTGKAQTWNDLADGLFAAMEKPRKIEYIEMPEKLRNQYQYFTEADMTKFRATGCPVPFRNLAAGIDDYVKTYLLKTDCYL